MLLADLKLKKRWNKRWRKEREREREEKRGEGEGKTYLSQKLRHDFNLLTST